MLILLPSSYQTVCYQTVQKGNHIQSCSLNQPITTFVSILMQILPFFHNLAIPFFLGNCNCLQGQGQGTKDIVLSNSVCKYTCDKQIRLLLHSCAIIYVITHIITDGIGLHSVLLPLLVYEKQRYMYLGVKHHCKVPLYKRKLILNEKCVVHTSKRLKGTMFIICITIIVF